MTSGGNLRLFGFFDVWFFCVTYICTGDVDGQFISFISASLLLEYNFPASCF